MSSPGPSGRSRLATSNEFDTDHWEDQDQPIFPTDMTSSFSSTSTSVPALRRTPKKSISGRASPTISQGSTPISPKRSIASPRRQKTTTTVRRRVVIPISEPRSQPQSQAQAQIVDPKITLARPAINDTLAYLLIPLRLLLAPIQALLTPFFFHLANGLLLALLGALAAYLLLPRLPSFMLSLTGKFLRLLVCNIFNVDYKFPDDISLGADVVLFPLRTLATPACALTGLMCPLSLLSASSMADNQTETKQIAEPFWRWGGTRKSAVNVGHVARIVTKEVRGAKDIFDSIRMLGDGNLAGGLEYVRVWELGIAVRTSSSLDDREFVGQNLLELGNLARDLSDEIGTINSQSVNAFSWLQWEFARLVQLLSLPAEERPDPSMLERRLHSLLLRLSSTLDDLHRLTSESEQHAKHASSHGSTLLEHLHRIKFELEKERNRSPAWKRVMDKSTHLVVGGEPTKIELIERDLSLAKDTIGNLGDLRWRLEDTRSKVHAFRDNIGMFSASMMGFHMGVSDEDGLGPEEEVRILASVVDELGLAVKDAKWGRTNRPIGIEG